MISWRQKPTKFVNMDQTYSLPNLPTRDHREELKQEPQDHPTPEPTSTSAVLSLQEQLDQLQLKEASPSQTKPVNYKAD